MPGAVAGYDLVMDDTIHLKLFVIVAVIFGLAGILTGNMVYVSIAALAVSNLIGSILMGGDQFGRRRTSPGRADSGPDHSQD